MDMTHEDTTDAYMAMKSMTLGSVHISALGA